MTTELETLRAELAETRAVLEDLLNERRPGETWLLKLLGRRDDLVQVVREAYDHEHLDCAACFSDPCTKDCFRFEFLAANDAEWLAGQINEAHEHAIAEDRHRFPMYGPPRQSSYQSMEFMNNLLQRVYDPETMAAAWRRVAAIYNTPDSIQASPHVPDGMAVILPATLTGQSSASFENPKFTPNMDALSGPVPTPAHSEPESLRPVRESDKTTDTEPQT